MTSNDDPLTTPKSQSRAPRLPDDAVVLRFGVSTPESIRDTALAHHDAPEKGGDFAVSVVSLPKKTADELAMIGGLPHSKIRETTVGDIRRVGYDVIPDEPPPGHALIMLPRLPADEDYVRISDVFGPPRANPTALNR